MHAQGMLLTLPATVAFLTGCIERTAVTAPDGMRFQEVPSSSPAANVIGISAVSSAAYVVVGIVSFIGPDCSAAVVNITNQGGVEQPFGWTLTLEVKKLKISQTFAGQQPLAAGETRETIIGTGITAPGTYHVSISAGGVSGKARSGSATLRLPATC